MSASEKVSALLTAIYTLTPTHCGTGATSGAVDLPVARESHSNFPILPASGLKGALRSRLRNDNSSGEGGLIKERLTDLFGPVEQNEKDGLKAGSLAFTEGHLLAYPMRTLSRPWLYVTAPCLLERLNREYRALTAQSNPRLPVSVFPEPGQVLVSDPALSDKTLMLEDFLYPGKDVLHTPSMASLAQALAELLPKDEDATRRRLQNHLVVISDAEFQELIQHAIPVQARIKLNERKTTTDDGGNLWYEEYLPSDCLFTSFVVSRPGSASNDAGKELTALATACEKLSFIQLGGNETVGQGMCWWRFHAIGTSSIQSGGGSGSGGAGAGGRGGTSAAGAGRQGPVVNSLGASRQSSPPIGSGGQKNAASSQNGPISLSKERQRFLYEKLISSNKKALLNELKGLPVQLRQSGLNVTLLDLLRRGGAARTIADWLSEWLLLKAPTRPLFLASEQGPLSGAQGLLEQCIRAKRSEYQGMQAEAGLLLEQAKSLAQSLNA